MYRINKGQVWVETVIYTLIGLAIIGVLLTFITPEIKERQDKAILEQSLIMMKNFENQIGDVRFYGTGNSRNIEFQIKKGVFIIDTFNDSIEFFMDSKYQYSELGDEIKIGNINATTKEKGNEFQVSFSLNYSKNLNFTWQGDEKKKIFQSSPTPYKVMILNRGKDNDLLKIEFSSSND